MRTRASTRSRPPGSGSPDRREYDRLYQAFASSLDPGERTRHYGQMLKLGSEGLPLYMTHFLLYVSSHSASLHGPAKDTVGTSGDRGTLPYWNIHEWELF